MKRSAPFFNFSYKFTDATNALTNFKKEVFYFWFYQFQFCSKSVTLNIFKHSSRGFRCDAEHVLFRWKDTKIEKSKFHGVTQESFFHQIFL